jgi:putative ABC transport system ATP-binding protein
MPPVIQAQSLGKNWLTRAGGFRLIVDPFAIHPGDFIAATGPSGCGKSTLLDLLGLVLRPDFVADFNFTSRDGKIHNLNQLSSRASARLRRSEIAYVLQTGGLLPFLSVRANIALPAQLNRQQDVKRRVEAIARKLGIVQQIGKKPAKLSVGERQRAAIARALVHEPALILADEPTSALDPPRARELVQSFADLCRERKVAVVMVTHQVELAEAYASKMFRFKVESHGVHQPTVVRCQTQN